MLFKSLSNEIMLIEAELRIYQEEEEKRNERRAQMELLRVFGIE